jgi:uncharacterized protein
MTEDRVGDEAATNSTGAGSVSDSTVADGRPRVVVGVDATEASHRALAWAAEEAALRGALLHAVFAWQYPFELADGTYVPPVPDEELGPWARRIVEDALAAVDPDRSLAVVSEARSGPAAAVLMAAAEGAELLVVGTSHRGRVTGLLLGSVSQYLAVHAPCPVVVVQGPRPDSGSGARREPAPRVAATAGLGTLEEIGEDECLGLLAGSTVGRLAVVDDGAPVVFTVNYVLDGRTVGIRTDAGTKLDAATLGRVAFQVDAIDPASHQGWSVLVQGVGRDVTDGLDAWSERIRKVGIEPWASGDKQHWIAIAPTAITGRRLREG